MPKVDKCGQGGREGVKNGTFVRTSFMDGPLWEKKFEYHSRMNTQQIFPFTDYYGNF